MKPKLIEKTTRMSNGKPRVTVSAKGSFFFNHWAISLLGAKKDTKIQIFQDEEDKQIWYIHITPKGYYSLSPKGGDANPTGSFASKGIAKLIFESLVQSMDHSLRFHLKGPVEHEGKTFFTLRIDKESLKIELPKNNEPYQFSRT